MGYLKCNLVYQEVKTNVPFVLMASGISFHHWFWFYSEILVNMRCCLFLIQMQLNECYGENSE